MGLVGIISFPKSGNTWIRSIVSSAVAPDSPLTSTARGQVHLPAVPDLHRDKLESAVAFNGLRFFKYHGGQMLTAVENQPLSVEKVIHVRRNPLDVFISYMNYISKNLSGSAPIPFASVDEIHGSTLFDMYFKTFTTIGHLAPRMVNTTGSYFTHNQYWLSKQGAKVVCVRYEDMLADTAGTLAPLKVWLGLDDAAFAHVISQAEQQTSKDNKFFWKRKEKSYFDYLTKGQIELFLSFRAGQCKSIGYDRDYFLTPPPQ